MPELDPIYVSVKEAARILGVSTWLMYQKLDKQIIESRYEGRKRLVSYASLKGYADSLSSVRPKPEVEAS
jgi:excisionase family DNA binding protein